MGVKVKVAAGVFAGLLVGALAGSLAVAWLRPPADTSPIDNATKSLLVTASVERMPVRDRYSMSAQVTAPTLAGIFPTSPGAAGREVVSGKVHKVGDTIHYGDVVAEVSGRPVFAVPASLPLYRDISGDDTGSDVAGLQKMLAGAGLYKGAADGKPGAATLQAIAKLYTRAGYGAPDPVGLLVGDTAPVPADGLKVASAAPVGSEISPDSPLLTVVAAPAVITARADMLQAQGFPLGAEVSVQIGSATPVPSKVLSVGDFQDGSLGVSPGYDVTISLPDGVDAAAAAQEPVVVSESADIPTGSAVPLSAIRRDANGATYVDLPPAADGATDSPVRHVSVTVLSQSSGYAIIQENPDLPTGAAVVVSGG